MVISLRSLFFFFFFLSETSSLYAVSRIARPNGETFRSSYN